MELETAKDILAEVFHARPGEVEEMIQRWLDSERELSGRFPLHSCHGVLKGDQLFRPRPVPAPFLCIA
jgi:hypothetical protein